MTTRNDVDVDFNPSPRIATVADPSVEFLAQDVVDTLRISEESFQGMDFLKLLDASGKEDLGGGVQVGITTTLQNTQIAFEGRTTAAQIGTVTTASTAPVNSLITLTDTSAFFEANNVQRGSLVINFTDQSVAEVFSVDSENSMRTRIPVNGSDNSYDFGDDYQVFNIIQCNISGGNVVAVDDADETISPVLPTAFTQVVRTSSSSATLVNNESSEEIASASAEAVWAFDVTNSAPNPNSAARHQVEGGMQKGAIWLDGIDGDDTQEGTVSLPILTFTQAKLVLEDYQMKRVQIVAMVDTTLTVNFDDYEVLSDVRLGKATLDLNGQSVANTYFEGIGLTGSISLGSPISPGISCVGSLLYSPMTNLGGTFKDCGFISDPGSPETFQIQTSGANFINCYTASVESTTPIPPRFDVSGTDIDVTFRRWSGSLEILGLDDAGSRVEIEASSGTVTLDASCTAGTIVVRGSDCDLVDNSLGTTVIDERIIAVTLSNIFEIVDEIRKYGRNRTLIDEVTFTLTVFDNDGVTPIRIFDLKDETGAASFTSIFERIPILTGSPGSP